MWPESGSGYEANQYSPAGQAQRGWWLLQGLERGNRRALLMVGTLPALAAVILFGAGIAWVGHAAGWLVAGTLLLLAGFVGYLIVRGRISEWNRVRRRR